MDKNTNQVLGLLLLVVGAILLAAQFLDVRLGWNYFWPVLAFILPGTAFHLAWGGQPGRWPFLIPGGILLTYGALFLYNAAVDYAYMGELWPFFIAGPGVGLLEGALLGGERHLLIPAGILLTVAAVFLSFTLGGGGLIIGGALILLGVLLLVRRA